MEEMMVNSSGAHIKIRVEIESGFNQWVNLDQWKILMEIEGRNSIQFGGVDAMGNVGYDGRNRHKEKYIKNFDLD